MLDLLGRHDIFHLELALSAVGIGYISVIFRFLDMDKKVCSLLVVLFYFLRSISGLITASLEFFFTEHFVWAETDIEVIYQYAAVCYSVDMLL